MTDQQDISALHSELRQMRRALNNQGADTEALNGLVSASAQTITELKNAMTLSHDQLRESRRHHLKLETANDRLTAEVTALQKERATLQKEFDVIRDKATINLKGEQARHKSLDTKTAATIDKLKKERAETLAREHAARETHLRETAALQTQQQELLTELTTSRAELDKMASAIEASTQSAQEMQRQLEESLRQKDADITRLNEESAQARQKAEQQHTQLEESLRQKDADIALLGEEISQTRQHAAQQQTQLEESLRQKDADIARLNEESAQARQKAEQQQTQRQDASDTKDSDIALLGEEISRLRTQNATLQTQNTALETQNVTLGQTRQQEVSELGTLLGQKEQAISTLAASQQRQAIIDVLRHPHERLLGQLSIRNPASTQRRNAAAQLANDVKIITTSDLFDGTWYKSTYPDIGTQDPAQHFAKHGLYELRNPGPGFDSLQYHLVNTDVTENGTPALLHYLRFGQSEGRKAHPVA